MQRHPIFVKYTRAWLHEVTGFSLNYLCRIATDRTPLSRSFIERACFALGQREGELFLTGYSQVGQCLQPGDCDGDSLGQWLQAKCEEENLSLRQMSIKVGVSHQTIAGLVNGRKALPETIKKLAKAFGGDHHQMTALEDKLLILAGYRTERPEEALSEPLAQLIDRAQKLNEPQLKIAVRFIDFLIETGS